MTDQAMAQKAGNRADDTSAPAMTQIHNFTHRATELAMTAMTLIGVHYKYGGNSPETGIDCSGLVRYVFKEAWGTTLPRTSLELSRVGEEVERDELQPGDLVFYNTRRRNYSHVGIYLGDNKFIHAPSSGKTVRIDNMEQGYWKTGSMVQDVFPIPEHNGNSPPKRKESFRLSAMTSMNETGQDG